MRIAAGVLLGLVALGFASVGVGFFVHDRVQAGEQEHVVGTVVEIASGTVMLNPATHQTSSEPMYPVVEFASGGSVHRFQSEDGQVPPVYAVGQNVKVRFDAGHPESAELDTGGNIALEACVCVISAPFFLVSGLLLVRRKV